MANFGIKIDLQKLQGAFVTNLKGKTATKVCLCIPIEEAGLFLGSKGVYIDLSAVEITNPKYEDTHCIKQQFQKERYNSMTEDERKAIPIIGGMHAFKGRTQDVTTTTEVAQNDDDDLPF